MRFYLSCLLSVGGDPPSSSLCNKGSSRATAQVPGERMLNSGKSPSPGTRSGCMGIHMSGPSHKPQA